MLTGDKLETAENIAMSCNLIARRDTVFRLKARDVEEDVVKALQEVEAQIKEK